MIISDTAQLKNTSIFSDKEQDRRTWLEIDRSAVLHNLAQFKKMIGQEVNLAAVLKSNAYGHGLIPMGSICQESSDVSWICIFGLSEGVALRQSGIKKHILVLGHMDVDPELAIIHNIDVVVYDKNSINSLKSVAKLLKKPAYVHVKIDTGLSRIGFFPEDAYNVIKELVSDEDFVVRGIITHMAESDAADPWYSYQQADRFNKLLYSLQKNNINIPFIHASNSSAVIRFNSMRYTMVRVGGGIYGLYKSNEIGSLAKKGCFIDLKFILSWKARIIQLKELSENTYVSYSRTYLTDRVTKTAILPVGYFDGYDRRLSNKGIVYIHGQKAPVIGRVAMNMIIIDVTHIPDIKIGDEATIMGNLPGITPNEIAQQIDSINYEVTTRINPAISRIIV